MNSFTVLSQRVKAVHTSVYSTFCSALPLWLHHSHIPIKFKGSVVSERSKGYPYPPTYLLTHVSGSWRRSEKELSISKVKTHFLQLPFTSSPSSPFHSKLLILESSFVYPNKYLKLKVDFLLLGVSFIGIRTWERLKENFPFSKLEKSESFPDFLESVEKWGKINFHNEK